MQKIIVFITDLYGTFFANENMYIRDLETKKLILYLEKIRIFEHADNVFFEFITLERREVLQFFLREFSLYLINSKIILKNQICKDGIYHFKDDKYIFEERPLDKLHQIDEEIDYFYHNYDVKAMYYADDAMFYQEKLLDKYSNQINLIMPSMVENYNSKLITSEKLALEGVNDCLNKKIKTFIKKI